MTQREKNNKIALKTATQWKIRAKKDRTNRKQISRSQKFALELLDYLDENNISQRELALRMDVSPQQVNKILRAKANLTFETLDKIEAALGVTLSSPTIVSRIDIKSETIKSVMTLVHKSARKQIEPTYSRSIGSIKNSILKTNLENVENLAFTADQI
ncbi:helix-turn-helix transcriptional regulator [Cytophaga sp. FL35]|uniref:helix-turn-helix transcriptional regulator n=1 Tax=Cytophaga sp. FL35 TaxID=1904456 RepID=UPI001653535E|nr:helix-turn-helix transcriptional regulator [Cytophaga sp. FL35]MBC7000702.1 helix-turn-helix transcriptional regulator [Cytophaga sp. FL35]